jgi:hypothetical protein
MKNFAVLTTLALAASAAFGQSADVTQSSQTTSSAQTSSMAIGGGQATSQINSSIGGSRASARGGAGGNAAGGASNSNVTVNLGSTDPGGSGSNATPNANSQNVPNGSGGGTIHESVKTVGNPGAMSFGVSFSQYNCANTAGVGVGFLGGAVSIGAGMESAPCNARANASALFSIAQAVATTNPQLSSQLFHAAILLIGNSTGSTKEALQSAGVADWAAVTNTMPINPPVPVPAPADESKATPVPTPQVAATPLQSLPQATVVSTPAQAVEVPAQAPLDHPITAEEVKAIMFVKPPVNVGDVATTQ